MPEYGPVEVLRCLLTCELEVVETDEPEYGPVEGLQRLEQVGEPFPDEAARPLDSQLLLVALPANI